MSRSLCQIPVHSALEVGPRGARSDSASRSQARPSLGACRWLAMFAVQHLQECRPTTQEEKGMKKKLTLHRETLRLLAQSNLKEARGAALPTVSCPTCGDPWTCPWPSDAGYDCTGGCPRTEERTVCVCEI